MATGGPESGPSESSRSCDLNLHNFVEQPWSVFAAALGRDYPLSDDKIKPLSKSYVHRFDSDYMGLFGFFPAREDFLGVVCDECNKIVNPQRVQQHLSTYHNHIKTDPLPVPILTLVPQVPSSQIKNEHRSTSKSQKHNSELHNSVNNSEDSKSWLQRSAGGRSKSVNKSLSEHSHKQASSKEVKTNATPASSNELAKVSESGTTDNEGCALLILTEEEETHPKLIPNKSNHVLSIKTSASTSPAVSVTTTQVNASSSVQKTVPTSQITTKSVQETIKAPVPSKVLSKSKFPPNFSLPLTFPLSCISDLTLLKPAVTSTVSTVPVSPVITASSTKKHLPVVSSAATPHTTNHVRLSPASASIPVPISAPVSTPSAPSSAPAPAPALSPSPLIHLITNTAINTVRVRNVNSNHNTHVHLNVSSVDYEQAIPKPSAICTFNSKKFRNQILFSPKMVTYKDAFDPVLSCFNHVQSQPHSRPPLVSNYNITNSMNGPSMHMPYSMNGNGYNHNPNVMRMPSTPVSPLKPVMIGGKPTSLRPLLPKCPSPIKAHTPYNYQYQNGYTNGVCSPPTSLATTSLKRLNPYSVMNNTEEAKQTRTRSSTDFLLVDDEDELPNGKTDLTTLMELEMDEP